MQLETVNLWGACSTILVRNFDSYSDDEEFRASMIYRLKNSKCTDVGSNLHSCHKFSFLMASTSSDQRNVQKYLRNLGFLETPETHNAKNGSKVILFFIPIPELYINLELENPSAPKEEKVS